MSDNHQIEKWQKCWKEGLTPWNDNFPNPYLWKHFHHLQEEDKQDGVFLIPLCGKTMNMKAIYEQGFRVVGIEIHEQPVKEFFREHNLSFDSKPLEGTKDGSIEYATKDGLLRILVTDFLKVTPKMVGAPVTRVWDRGALGSIQKGMRRDYVNAMIPLLAPNVRYLLDVYQYNDWYYEGPPRTFPREMMKDLLEGKFRIQEIDRVDDGPIVHVAQEYTGVKPVYTYIYLLKLK